MGNPWQHKIQYKTNYLELDSLFNSDSGFEAKYHFRINKDLGDNEMRSIRAVVERSGLWQVSINGKTVVGQKDMFWIDKDFTLFEVGEHLKKGENTLSIKAPRMHILAEVMPVYLLGDFLVKPARKGFEITGGKITTTGSWQKNGLPFYSQKVSYKQSFDVKKSKNNHYKVRLNNWNGSISEVWVNGEQSGVIAWQPNELDITPYVKEGNNEVTVKVTGSLKNTFGFFYRNNDSWIHGPHSWNYAPKKLPAASEYFLLDYGLFEPFSLIQMN
jgi:hypothetical protein